VQGWLLAPRPAVSAADLDAWFAGPGGAAPRAGGAAPALVCWRDGTGPLVAIHAPRQAWLLACSLAALGAALGLFFVARAAAGPDGPAAADWLWPAAAVTALALAAAGLFWPAAVSALLYGAEPAAAVLALLLVLHGARHLIYRRRVVTLASFQPAGPGSAMDRAPSGVVPVPAGLPSTVDSPRPRSGSSQRPAAPPELAPQGSQPGQAPVPG
jgi:hypothetical protein